MLAILCLSYSKPAYAEYTGGKFPHTPGQIVVLKWYYSGGTRYLGNVWQGGQNWRNGSARVRTERTTNIDENHIYFRDVWKNNVSRWAATYLPNSPTYYYVYVEMNATKIDGLNDFMRTKVATHEFGHTFGLDETPSNQSANSVMKQGYLNYNTVQSYDTTNINNLYN